MIEQLDKVKTIYDLFALCSSYIFNELKVKTYEFALFKDEEYENVYDAIDRYCCEKQENGVCAAFTELIEFMYEYLQVGITIERCFAVVKYIDDLVEIDIPEKLLGGNGIVKYSSLNHQYKDKVKIIPKMRETFVSRSEVRFKKVDDNKYSLFRKRRECACSVLDRETVNYMVWDEEKIQKYPVWIYRLNQKNSISKHFYEREKVSVGIVPLTNRRLEELLDIKYKGKTFYIEKMYEKAQEELRERYIDAYNRCKNKEIDFLLFPEMLMTNEIIRSPLSKMENESPQIIVNGSVWKDYMNKTVVTDGNGNEIFYYLKKEPFTFEKNSVEYKEYLDSSQNKEYSILEIEGVGRIGLCICKDLISEEVKMFHKYINTDILLVPAYTKSMDLQASAENLSTEYNCIVVVINACSAFGEENEKGNHRRIGFVSLPAKAGTDRTKITFPYCKNDCVDGCHNKCMGRIITIDFAQTKQYDGIISYSVYEDVF